jgi:hypothetical protein
MPAKNTYHVGIHRRKKSSKCFLQTRSTTGVYTEEKTNYRQGSDRRPYIETGAGV